MILIQFAKMNRSHSRICSRTSFTSSSSNNNNLLLHASMLEERMEIDDNYDDYDDDKVVKTNKEIEKQCSV